MSRVLSAILTYHSIDRSGSVISVTPEIFRKQMQVLADGGLTVVPLARIREIPRAVALTFDDGFRNFLEHAMPVLERHHFPATVFVVSGRCGKQNDWPGQWPGTPRLELMNWSELRTIVGRGVELGAHTVNHPDLTKLTNAAVHTQMADSRAEIERETGARVESFAYPYGAVNHDVRRAAQQCFATACGTQLRFVQPGSDPADLPRLDMYYLRRLLWFRQLMSPAGRGYVSMRNGLRRIRLCFRSS